MKMDRKRRRGGGELPFFLSTSSSPSSPPSVRACLLFTLLPALVLCLSAVALLVAHQTLGGGSGGRGDHSSNLVLASLFSSANGDKDAGGGGDDFFTRFSPLTFENAHHLEDIPDYEASTVIYEDAHVQKLMRGDAPSFVAFDVTSRRMQHHRHAEKNTNQNQNAPDQNLPLLQNTMGHPVYTALRDLDDVREFFNPVCYRYRFPNATLFPSVSIVMTMAFNGTSCVNTK